MYKLLWAHVKVSAFAAGVVFVIKMANTLLIYRPLGGHVIKMANTTLVCLASLTSLHFVDFCAAKHRTVKADKVASNIAPATFSNAAFHAHFQGGDNLFRTKAHL